MAAAARLDNMLLQYQEGFLSDETFESTFKEPVRVSAPRWKQLEEASGLEPGQGAGMAARRESFRREVERILSEEEASNDGQE